MLLVGFLCKERLIGCCKIKDTIMINKVKEDLFTIPGIVTTLIHVCFVVGVVTCWIGIQTQVLGNDPVAEFQKQSGRSK